MNNKKRPFRHRKEAFVKLKFDYEDKATSTINTYILSKS